MEVSTGLLDPQLQTSLPFDTTYSNACNNIALLVCIKGKEHFDNKIMNN